MALALLLAWCLVLASRNAWTPDEPRELALSASQVEHFTALPTLGGIPFTEKPPLAYWISGAAMRVLGVSGAAARAPLLIYALIAIGCVFMLGRRMGTPDTGITAALIFATAWLVFNVQIWLATDALLLAAVTIALLGIHLAFGRETRGRDFGAGCALLHLGLLLALFTKNLAGWLVPLTTLFAYLLLERRLRALWHPAVWLPALAGVALMYWWAVRIAAATGGDARLHALFWDNLAGRLVSFADSSNAVRALGHRNWPGKYLVELPLYLLPWTPLIVGMAMRLWRERRASGTGRTVRFALCAFVPGLVILSCAATARGTYAAPIIPGIALLTAVALNPADPDPATARRVPASLRATTWLVLLFDGGMLAGIVALHAIRGRGDSDEILLAAAGLLVVAGICVALLLRLRARQGSAITSTAAVTHLAGAHVATIIAMALSLFPLLNRSQDLARIATFIESASGGRPLVLWLPDETTLAMSDLYMRKPACSILFDVETEQQRATHLARCLREYPDAAVVGLANCPPSQCDRTLGVTTPVDPLQRRRLEFQDSALAAAGVRSAQGIVRPGGRAYLVGFRTP